MAAPGLGYVKRDVEKTTVDWGAISGGLTTALGGAFAAGEKQKAETALADQTMAGEIQKLPKGVTPDQSKYFSSAIQNIGDANQKIKEQYDNGEISATQYKIAVNSLNTQYQIFKNNAANYQNSYEDFIKKVTDGKSGATTQLVATWVDQMAGMNKSVRWNPETQILESVYIGNGNEAVSPVSNDLSLMNYYNTAFDNDLIVKGKQRFGQMVSSTTGIDAAEYLAAEKGYKLVSGVPQNENEIQVINNKNGIPEVVDIEKYQKLAVDGFKESILVSLDNTYKQKEGAAQYDVFLENKEQLKKYKENTNEQTLRGVLDYLSKFNPNKYVSKSQGIRDKEEVSIEVEDPNMPGQVNIEKISFEEYVKRKPGAAFFEKDKQGRFVPVQIDSFNKLLNYMNKEAGIENKEMSAFEARYDKEFDEFGVPIQ